METIYLSLRPQVAVCTFFMKSPVLCYSELCFEQLISLRGLDNAECISCSVHKFEWHSTRMLWSFSVIYIPSCPFLSIPNVQRFFTFSCNEICNMIAYSFYDSRLLQKSNDSLLINQFVWDLERCKKIHSKITLQFLHWIFLWYLNLLSIEKTQIQPPGSGFKKQ